MDRNRADDREQQAVGRHAEAGFPDVLDHDAREARHGAGADPEPARRIVAETARDAGAQHDRREQQRDADEQPALGRQLQIFVVRLIEENRRARCAGRRASSCGRCRAPCRRSRSRGRSAASPPRSGARPPLALCFQPIEPRRAATTTSGSRRRRAPQRPPPRAAISGSACRASNSAMHAADDGRRGDADRRGARQRHDAARRTSRTRPR